MCDEHTIKATEMLEQTQQSIEQLLKGAFDAETRRLLNQVQVHVHEALHILRQDALMNQGARRNPSNL